MHSVVKLVAVTAWAMLAHAISIRWAVKHAVFSLEGSLRRVITILFPRLRETSPVARLHSQTLKAKSFPAGGVFVSEASVPVKQTRWAMAPPMPATVKVAVC